MYGIVRIMAHSDEVLRIEHRRIEVYEILGLHRIHVVNEELSLDLHSFNAQVSAQVSSDRDVS